MSDDKWAFDQTPDTAAISSTHIFKNSLPILLITHYEDDHSWGFQSGLEVTMEDVMVVGMKEIVTIDPTVVEVANLEPGWSAQRTAVGAEWVRSKSDFPDEANV